MTREEAIETIRRCCPKVGDSQCYFESALRELVPELRESEDERIRKALIDGVRQIRCKNDITQEQMIAYLEKQKELHFDYPGLYFYDGEKLHFQGNPATEENPYDFAMSQQEKQKEQKPKHFELKAGKWYICHRAFCCRADHLTVKEGERFMCEKDGIVKGFVIKEPEKYFKECSAPAPMEDEQKPVARENDFVSKEWSEEDEAFLKTAIAICNRYSHKDIADWLKSLRPPQYCEDCKLKKSVQGWKPSEEQMEALLWCTAHLGGADHRVLAELYEHLRKLREE